MMHQLAVMYGEDAIPISRIWLPDLRVYMFVIYYNNQRTLFTKFLLLGCHLFHSNELELTNKLDTLPTSISTHVTNHILSVIICRASFAIDFL